MEQLKRTQSKCAALIIAAQAACCKLNELSFDEEGILEDGDLQGVTDCMDCIVDAISDLTESYCGFLNAYASRIEELTEGLDG